MPFLFSYVCDLLQSLDNNRLARSGLRSKATIIQDWFRGHQAQLYRDELDTAALLSALLPEKGTDRVYFLREKKLQTVIGRALGLGRSRIAQLGRWSNPEARVDLAECVESILNETPNPVSPTERGVTVEEIDQLLHAIAATCRFSSPAVRSSASAGRLANKELALGDLYKRLPARDAKWLTRLILKNYEPVVLDQHVVCQSYHPLLPAILNVQDDLAAASRILDSYRRGQKVTEAATGLTGLAQSLKPTLGVKIGRQKWIKGRSIKHCLSMVQGRISCEEKMDGEYCQIHIDLSKDHDCIQIFSKSGKDSTRDRLALHESIRNSLHLGKPSCPLKKGCILEGELVVYSDKDSKVLDFHKIRKHVSRSGSFLGTSRDSQPHPWEHLMIVYYDLLMIDDESLLFVKHSERFQRLKDLIAVVPGRYALVKRVIIDCDRPSATSDLRRAFAKCITARGEGLVLKADDPYFDWSPSRRPYACCAIKLKKEYIGHFGDIGDFAVVGARYDAAKARAYTIPKVKWTHFYVGCLENKDEVRRFGKRPQFVITNVVELNATQLDVFTTSINPEAVPAESNTTISLRIEPGIDNGKRPSVIFPTPPVVDLRCFSFEKEGNKGFWSPRFPSVTKIHSDRTYHDALSFDELQDMAIKEKELPPPEDNQELLGWIAALEQSEPTATVGETSQSSVSTGAAPMTPSHKSSQSCQSPVSPGPRLRGPREIDSPTSRRSTSTQTGQLTPPRSSAIQVPESATPNVLLDINEAAQNRKRPHEALGCDNMHERAKMQRCSSDHISTTRPSQSNSMNLTATGLVGASASPSRRNSHAGLRIPRLSASRSMPRVDMEGEDSRVRDAARLSVPASQSFHGVLVPVFASSAPSSGSSVLPSKHNNISFNQVSATTAETTAIRNCRSLGDSCKLSTYSIMLSPCIANFPWVTENLLVSHGVTEFIRDPKAWLRDGQASGATAAVPSTSDISANGTAESAGHPSSLNKKRRRCKKLVLVDARRREATEAFLASIQAAQLKRRNGEREYVPVFDWRVLESVMEEERRCCLGKEKPAGRFEISSGQSIWKQYWIGLA